MTRLTRRNSLICPALALALALAATGSGAAALPLACGDPGPVVMLPGACAGYAWSVPITAIQPGVTVASFTVSVSQPSAVVDVFQAFGTSGPAQPLRALFDVYINDSLTAWTSVHDLGFIYHASFAQTLFAGDHDYRVVLRSLDDLIPDRPEVELRFGSVVPAIPLPAVVWVQLTGLAWLGLMRARRRRQRQRRQTRTAPRDI